MMFLKLITEDKEKSMEVRAWLKDRYARYDYEVEAWNISAMEISIIDDIVKVFPEGKLVWNKSKPVTFTI